MKYFLFYSFFIFSCFSIQSQTAFPDDVLKNIKSKLSSQEVEQILNQYSLADDMTKTMMINIYSMPLSSKRELIDNYEKKKKEIKELQVAFEEMIPENYIVFLELKQSEQIAGMVVGIDLQIYKKNDSGDVDFIDGDWDMDYSSEELTRLLNMIGWDRMTLLAMKNIIQTANCISIQNGDVTEIGFARSGLGKYFYELFPDKLSKSQIDTYNDGCEYLFYKDNVALRYVGGMAGPQCFTN